MSKTRVKIVKMEDARHEGRLIGNLYVAFLVETDTPIASHFSSNESFGVADICLSLDKILKEGYQLEAYPGTSELVW